MSKLTLICGDAFSELRRLPADSVQCCVTSPPYYGLRDYGIDGQLGLEPTLDGFLERLAAVFDEVQRVLHPSGVCFVDMGDSYASSPAGNFGPDMPRPGNGGAYGANTVKTDWRLSGLKPKDRCLVPFRLALLLQSRGWWVRDVIAWTKPAPMPESVTDRCTQSWEPILMLTKSARYFWDAEAVKEQNTWPDHNRFGNKDAAARCVNELTGNMRLDAPEEANRVGRNLRNVWPIGPEPYTDTVKVKQVTRVSADEASDGMKRIASEDCPVHGSRRVSSAQCDALGGRQSLRTEHIETRPVLEPSPAPCPTSAPSLAGTGPQSADAPAAIYRSKQSSKTHLERLTNVPCNASEETACGTGHTASTPDDSELYPGTPTSKTAADSVADAQGLLGGMLGGTPCKERSAATAQIQPTASCRETERSTESNKTSTVPGGPSACKPSCNPCTCSYEKEVYAAVSHFASFPAELPKRCILAATSAKGVCGRCGAPWERDIVRVAHYEKRQDRGQPNGAMAQVDSSGWRAPTITDNGWSAGCTCSAGIVPATVIDPFCGTGTTCAVALDLGRAAIGIELNPAYVTLAQRRCGAVTPGLALA
jgi:DNA modification methylase